MQTISFSDKLQRFILNWFFLMLVWIMFTSTFAVQEVVIGAIVTMFISLMSISMFTCCTLKLLSPVRIFWMLYYFVVFLIALVKANLDVARRVLSPSLPINPGVVKFKTKLTTNYSKMVLANSITLTPGTLTIDVIDDTFYIHWIDVTTTDPEKAFTEIAESFEKVLLKIF
ncbi:MAG: Na+/H+ antiporter subunit E [Bacteroidales bacterium]|nr:Na+/H+ antiporter subunit E [Bacteroidales bacterium]